MVRRCPSSRRAGKIRHCCASSYCGPRWYGRQHTLIHCHGRHGSTCGTPQRTRHERSGRRPVTSGERHSRGGDRGQDTMATCKSFGPLTEKAGCLRLVHGSKAGTTLRGNGPGPGGVAMRIVTLHVNEGGKQTRRGEQSSGFLATNINSENSPLSSALGFSSREDPRKAG